MSQKQRAVYNQKCYINPNVSQGEHLNENHLIKNLMTSLSSDQLIIFGKVDEIGYKTVENHLVVQTNGILKWKSNLENFIWKNQGKFFPVFKKNCFDLLQNLRVNVISEQPYQFAKVLQSIFFYSLIQDGVIGVNGTFAQNHAMAFNNDIVNI